MILNPTQIIFKEPNQEIITFKCKSERNRNTNFNLLTYQLKEFGFDLDGARVEKVGKIKLKLYCTEEQSNFLFDKDTK